MVVLMLIQISHLNLRPEFQQNLNYILSKIIKDLIMAGQILQNGQTAARIENLFFRYRRQGDASYGFLRTEKFCKCMGMPYYKNKEKTKKISSGL